MIFSYSTNAFTRFSLTDAIEKIAGMGFSGLEIMCDCPHLFPDDYTDTEIDALSKQIKKHRLAITNLNCFTLFAVEDTYLPSWIELDEKRRKIRIDHTLKCIRTANRIGCKNISIPPGGPLNHMTRQEAGALFYSGLEKVVPLAESLKVKLLIEPEPDLFIENSREFRAFITDIRSDFVGLNFDIGHFFCVGEDPSKAFESLFQWIGHVHLEDIGPDHVHHHLIAGEGAIDFDAVFNAMKHLKYAGDICLELYPYTDRPTEAGIKSMAHLKPILDKYWATDMKGYS